MPHTSHRALDAQELRELMEDYGECEQDVCSDQRDRFVLRGVTLRLIDSYLDSVYSFVMALLRREETLKREQLTDRAKILSDYLWTNKRQRAPLDEKKIDRELEDLHNAANKVGFSVKLTGKQWLKTVCILCRTVSMWDPTESPETRTFQVSCLVPPPIFLGNFASPSSRIPLQPRPPLVLACKNKA